MLTSSADGRQDTGLNNLNNSNNGLPCISSNTTTLVGGIYTLKK
jgi:hypothetical protein